MASAQGALETVNKGVDLLGLGEVASIMHGAAGWLPGEGFTPGADKVLGPMGTAFSAFNVAKGGYEATDAINSGDGVKGCDAAHDLLSGGAGLLGNVKGPVGAVAKAFGAGMTVGDMIAPYIFGSEEDSKGAHSIPVQDVYKPSCGNDTIDGALDFLGVR